MWPPRRVDGMSVRHPFALASDRVLGEVSQQAKYLGSFADEGGGEG